MQTVTFFAQQTGIAQKMHIQPEHGLKLLCM